MNESFSPANGPQSLTSRPEELIGKTIPFSDPNLDKTTDVKINKINRILGKGTFASWVADIEIEVANEKTEKTKTRNMAIKKYTEDEKVEEYILRSYDNFKILKNLKIPTWDTYRLNIKERLALMTLGCKENEILFTTNDINGPKAEPFLESPIKEIENIDEFIAQLKSILKILNENSMSLNGDSWGFVLRSNKEKEGFYSLTALAADIDFVNTHKNEDVEKIKGYNEHNLIVALHFMYPGTKQEKDKFVDFVYKRLEENKL